VRLRTTLTVVMTGVGSLAIGVALALVILTSALNQTSIKLGGAAERVHLLMELESYALQHVRQTGDPESPTAIDIISRLRDTSEPELREDIQRLDEMIASVAAASTPAERESRFDAVVRALRSVVAREDEDARRAMAAAASWNRLANITGIIAVVVLIAGVAGFLAWLWRSAFQPLVTVSRAIERFAKGDEAARVAQRGPSEIRQIAVAFNDMAASLGRQREQQLAFIGGVAHDLRNPVGALQVAVALLDRQPSDPSRIRDRVRRQVARLEHMIGDLLDRTRIEAGRLDLQLADCDLRDIVTPVAEGQQESSARVFKLMLPNQPVPVQCDALRMEQVLNNLLSNAVKYSPDSSDVEVVLERDGTTAVLSVTDHGIGMTAADRTRIFEAFRRGENVGTIGGAGLGLSVTRKIVEAHGGSIDVRSKPGSGSVLSVRLPLALAADVNRSRSGNNAFAHGV